MTDLLARLTAQQQKIAAARPLPAETLRSLMDDFLIRFAHETTAIEGNTLTLQETQVVLEHGITVAGKTLREHLEVVNVRGAWDLLLDLVRAPLTEAAILDLHRLLMQGILGDEAGRLRTVPVFIRGSMHVPPNPARVGEMMSRFVEDVQVRPAGEHPVRFAARAHVDLAAIHPFVDGNGRVCRMLGNLLLMRAGWPPALYTAANRAAYLRALVDAQFRGDAEPCVHVTAEAVQFMMDRYLIALDQLETP